jgi:hypothetical protein
MSSMCLYFLTTYGYHRRTDTLVPSFVTCVAETNNCGKFLPFLPSRHADGRLAARLLMHDG